jgi:SAM-dependent methyltransferase
VGVTIERHTDPAVVWHDVECGAYTADLPVWHELADAADGPVLDLGAGTGRVALSLARAGHEIVALDRDAALLRALEERATGLPISAVCADARDFDLPQAFALCIVPMQTLQIVGSAGDRARLLRCAHRHLAPGGTFAAALAADLEPFDASESASPPLPDLREDDGVLYASRPVALRRDGNRVVIERIRETVSPRGDRIEERDVVVLADLVPAALEAELRGAGFATLPARHIAPTREHVGSWVVTGRA